MTATNKLSDSARKAQTEKFFQQLEQQILQRLRNEASSPQGREELLRATGIHDEHLLDELGQLGVTADGLMALRLFPLVLVAWAEEKADESERNAVMTQAVRLGIREDTTAWVLLDQWLTKRPPGLGVDAWKQYTHEVFLTMSEVARNRLIQLTETQMTEVAKASGGHFGFGKVSKKEQAVIQQIVLSMKRC
ncbi:hypothetical protein K227x_04740 [Rubripirellula lacrimiformis]|uniref:Uncharacterized protein n=1 Tax=Rubripirellula lacrimiformis TaxID=1930273 RepID=A0A517N4P1_9BACT|nr:hypothetical protein [Rubripirellula lacrimiformis]QDT02103.1 hypothetical protein K227x_04740 [Rubripirellula lacrimiformis]